MLENINYNLIETISIISKSLYRYDAYIKDAAGCASCQSIWAKFKAHRESELSMMIKELKEHTSSGRI